MRTIIAGSRTCDQFVHLLSALAECGWVPTVVLSGKARGADNLGEIWAKKNNVPVEQYPADWEKFGKKAGYLRNLTMLRKLTHNRSMGRNKRRH